MNRINQVKTLQLATAERVKQLLNWNDQQYGTFQFEQGYEYLKYWIGEGVWGFDELPHTSAFWAWWRNHWHKRDIAFVSKAPVMSLNERLKTYEHIHSPEAIEYMPHSAVMEEAYAKMIYQVTHGEVVL